MATLYKNRGIWYITTSVGNRKLTKSLRTKDRQIAKKLKPTIELELLSQLSGVTTKTQSLSFKELVSDFLKSDHNWSKSTYETY